MSSAAARDWAVWLTRQPSVTGSPGERALPHALKARLEAAPGLAGASVWLIPTRRDRLERHCVAALLRGEGPDTLLLTGHFDTVSTEDYGDLAAFATEPEALREALLRRLTGPAGPRERRAHEDLASGDFLPGRGLLDMKAGLAAGLAAMEAFAALPHRPGNLLFVAVPDEEATSLGARTLAEALPGIEREHGLSVVGAINLDCIGDDGDGSLGRSVALGSVGKLLLTALAVGRPTHASHPFQGLNAGVIAAAIATEVEWSPELADGEPGIPPTLLGLQDGKTGYDVTTPATVFANWNVLLRERGATATLDRFEVAARQALDDLTARLSARRARLDARATPAETIPVLRIGALIGALDAAGQAELAALEARLAKGEMSLPEQNRRLSEAAWRLSGRDGPAAIIGFGSLPYPSAMLSDAPPAARLKAAIETARLAVQDETGTTIGVTPFFPGISDVSFIGEGRTEDVPLIAANTPAWRSGVRWNGAVAGIPTVNIGPWGRDYHTPLERVHEAYAFDTLPRLLVGIARALFAPSGSTARP
jgi:arginine utilization protein RocB